MIMHTRGVLCAYRDEIILKYPTKIKGIKHESVKRPSSKVLIMFKVARTLSILVLSFLFFSFSPTYFLFLRLCYGRT